MSLTQINKAGLDEIALDHVFTIGASGSSAYTFQGEGLNGTVNNPTLYLTRGKTYRFENGTGAHPIRIQSTSGASGTAYNTGVTNNAGSGTVIVEVQHDAPDVLYYQCTSHAAMNGILYITGALADGGVTTAKIAADAVTTAKIADDAVTSAKLADSSVQNATIATGAVTTTKINDGAATTAKIANDAVTTAKIADQAITAGKLASGVQTTINSNADNRVITGSGTANTLNGESNLTVGAQGDLHIKDPGNTAYTNFTGSTDAGLIVGNGTLDSAGVQIRTGTSGSCKVNFGDGDGSSSDRSKGFIHYLHSNNSMGIGTNSSQRVTIDSSGNVGIGTTSPQGGGLTVENSSEARLQVRAGSNGSNGIIALRADGGNTQLGTWSNHDLKIVRNNSIKASFTSDGLCFNSDTAAANALDDYEEGTWTPTLTNVYAAGTSSGRVCVYRKIGQMVFITFDIFASASNMDINTSGDTVIGGLPFTTPANFNTTFQVAIYMNNASGQQMANYVNTGPQIVLHGSSRINNVRHLWGFGCYPAS